MSQFRIKESLVDAIKVADVLEQVKGDKALEPAWLLNAYNDGVVRFEDQRVIVGIDTFAYPLEYLVCTPNDGPGVITVMSDEDFLARYVPATDEQAPSVERGGPPKVSPVLRHAEIGQVLLNIGNRLKDERPDDGRPLLDFGAELIRDAQ